MSTRSIVTGSALFLVVGALLMSVVSRVAMADDKKAGPAVGETAPAVELKTLTDEPVSLAALSAKQPVVVMFLRGYPGYQCPLCSRQVGSFLTDGDDIKAAGAQVVFIYPGAAEKLKEYATEFVHGKKLPEHFNLVVDPDFVATNAWNLRWDEKNETAYPATFVVDTGGVVRFAKVSTGHGDRSTPEQVLEAIKALTK